MAFSDIDLRANGETIVASWFNSIRTALVSFFGTENINTTSFSALASQTNANVTGLVFSSASTESVRVFYQIETATLFEKGEFDLIYDGSSWELHQGAISGDNSGITFDVNASTGQVTYSSGGETSTIKFSAITVDA